MKPSKRKPSAASQAATELSQQLSPRRLHPENLQLTLDFQRLKISLPRLQTDYQKHTDNLADIGITDAPKLSIRQGFWQQVRHFARLNTWAVVVPYYKAKGGKNAVRVAMHNVMATQKLHLLKTHKREAWRGLSQQYAAQETATRRSLRKYILHTRSKSRLANALSIKFLGIMPAIRMGKRSQLSPQKLSISAYGAAPASTMKPPKSSRP